MILRIELLLIASAAALLLSQTPAPDPYQVPFRHVIIDDQFPAEKRFFGDCKGAGDVDGDGYADIIFGGSELVWYRYPNWTKTVIAPAEEEFTTDMQVGDVDGDGDLDIIVPDGREGKVFWFENPRPAGDPAETAWKRHLIGLQGSFTHDVEIGDVDGDGKLDVLTRKTETFLWMQKTPDAFTKVSIPNTVLEGEGSALADLNRDGRLDIVQGGYWLECPPNPASGKWVRHDIDPNWPRQVAVTVWDVNGDGRLDVLLAPAESAGKLVWYEAPPDPASGKWVENVIDDDVEYLHTFKLGDMNNFADAELVAAEMHQSKRGRVMVYYRQKGKWRQQVVATTGSHNLRLADIGADGDLDIIGANWGGKHHPLEMWENTLVDRAKLNLDNGWSYTLVDGKRAKWGDFDKPSWMKYFGLAFGDVNADGRTDMVSGRYFYRNPGRDGVSWPRVDFGMNVDAVLLVDVDGDGRLDAIGQALPALYWLRPADRQGEKWQARRVATVPATGHVNGQGAALAQIVPGGKPEILLSAGDGTYCIEIPDNPASRAWPATRIAAKTSEEGIAAADLDGDGLLDLVASEEAGHRVGWWKNPGRRQPDWERHDIGETVQLADRVAIADINRDGRLDVVVTEESPYSDASVHWFEHPGAVSGAWKRRFVVTQFTTNNLDVTDMDGDGDPDIVTAEHRGSRKLSWWENRDRGSSWAEHVIDTGKEGHLGARVTQMEGVLAIASIAWDTYPDLHLWKRTAPGKAPARK